ncbi:TonB-dependent siderophore receptor [Nostoc sp. UHCC 0870]|uniref:TonB-dependent siderophore receptor n=1 Tax=Nostoc sp. UHCC 0870 TaxID=2914041 RepID=UPI001EDDB6C5|nr:TonB-dependent siderophore receptor [Nostoc sp. UHCC 0870]UKO96904.1 TonB-dependent siderophore receptor [Nostoc sp. UHCC 0870]
MLIKPVLLHHLCLAAIVSILTSNHFVRAEVNTTQNKTPRLSKSVPMLVQAPTNEVVQVTGVKANPTEKGVEVILQTTVGDKLQLVNSSQGNAYIADIPNAQLRLPNGDAFTFSSPKPREGINEITVTNLDANTIRVTVTGEAGLPVVELFDSDEGLILGVVSAAPPQTQATPTPEPEQPSAATDQPIELVVTGEQDSYRVTNAATATKTDTALRDIPQSIQVIPRQVIEDQRATQLNEALRNVSGVQPSNSAGRTRDRFVIRGFDDFNSVIRDGFKENTSAYRETANIERIEVLKGPASVLFGQLEPGGVVNIITKQPQREPFLTMGLEAGSYGFFRPTVDFNSPLNDSKTLRLRVNAAVEVSESFRDFDKETSRFFIAPVLAWDIGNRTSLVFDLEYLKDSRPFDRGLVALGDRVADIPFNRILGEPFDSKEVEDLRIGTRFEHGFNDNWKLRSALRIVSTQTSSFVTEPDSLDETTGLLSRGFGVDRPTPDETYAFQTDLIGKFKTGAIEHELVVGFDFNRQTNFVDDRRSAPAPAIDIFNPVYLTARPNIESDPFRGLFAADNIGIYIQDQIKLAENLKLLIGGRYDFTNQSFLSIVDGVKFFDISDQAFSPRIGIVYQPITPLSLYASYSRSFAQNFGIQQDNSRIEPERGTQYEVGVRGEFLDGKLITSLAGYQITKTNVATPDPADLNFSIPVGEVRSRGIEFDIAGELAKGWNIIASYAYTDAKITEDNTDVEGNRLNRVPENSASIWTTYELQSGALQGLGMGVGLFFVGERQGDLSNSFTVPGYTRTDAALFYRRDNWNLGLNFKNIFDVNYIESTTSRTSIDAGIPFTVIGSLSVKF